MYIIPGRRRGAIPGRLRQCLRSPLLGGSTMSAQHVPLPQSGRMLARQHRSNGNSSSKQQVVHREERLSMHRRLPVETGCCACV